MSTDWHVYQEDKRRSAEDDERFLEACANPKPKPPVIPRCLKCGWAIEHSKHFGAVWTFDHGTETIHVCRESHGVVLARLRGKLYREDHAND